MVTYGAETWVINKSAEKKTLMIFKRNILRNIFGLVLKDNKWRIRTNVELEKLYKDVNIGTIIKLQHFREMGHQHWKDDARTTKKIHQATIRQKLPE